jgi:hypothetical protein
MTLRLGQMLHRERTEIAQGRHRGLVINLARVTVAKLNCCTDCLASLSSTAFMYAPVAIAALDIQRASQASFALALYRVSQEEWTKLRESVPYVKIYRYNPKHLCPKLNGYGNKGKRKLWSSCGYTYCTWFA